MHDQTEQINHWFKCNIWNYSSEELVQACEDCAHWYEHDEWLDDSEHEVWEIGAEWFDKGFGI